MNDSTHKDYNIYDDPIKEFKTLTKQELFDLPKSERRNQKCYCGSGKKFKYCCQKGYGKK